MLTARSPCCSALATGPATGRRGLPEVALFRKLYPDGVPGGADLMQDFIDAIRAGTLDLTPGPNDGWYAHQLYALCDRH